MGQLDYLLPGGVRQGSAADERTAQLVHPAVTWGHVSQVRGDAGVKSGGHRQGAGGMPLRLLDWLLGTRQARFLTWQYDRHISCVTCYHARRLKSEHCSRTHME